MSQDIEQSGSDNLKLILAGLLGLGSCLTIVGIVPVAILLIGAALAYKSGDISNARTTTRFVQFVLGLASLLSWAVALYQLGSSSFDSDETAQIAFVVGLLGILLVWLLNVLWCRPIERSLERRQAISRQNAKSASEGPSIMAREALAPYSTADELLKWKRLLDEDLITREEFDEARAKIISGR